MCIRERVKRGSAKEGPHLGLRAPAKVKSDIGTQPAVSKCPIKSIPTPPSESKKRKSSAIAAIGQPLLGDGVRPAWAGKARRTRPPSYSASTHPVRRAGSTLSTP